MDKKRKCLDDVLTNTGLLIIPRLLHDTFSMLYGGKKMFGNEYNLKNVVREMMEGATTGILFHFENKIDSLKQDIEILNRKKDELEEKLEKQLEKNDDLTSEVLTLEEKLEKLEKKKSKKK
jgi:hypothetical protein